MPRAEMPGLFARGELLFPGAAVNSPAFVDASSPLRKANQRRLAGRASRALFCGMGVVDSLAVLTAGVRDHRFAFRARPLRLLVHAAKGAPLARPSRRRQTEKPAKPGEYIQQCERGRVAA